MTRPAIGAPVRSDAPELTQCRVQVGRLPITLRPSLNKQLDGWDDLFPYERKRLRGFISGVAALTPSALDSLTVPLRAIENRMQIAQSAFAPDTDTMQNASLLARSPYYAEWRHEVQRVFAAIEAAAPIELTAASQERRLIFIVLPESLPVAFIANPKPWDRRALEFRIEGDPRKISEFALVGKSGIPAQLSQRVHSTATKDSSDCWLVDASSGWLKNGGTSSVEATTVLEYAELKRFRDEFLAQVNTVPKDIAATDQVLERMRSADWRPLWPASLAGQDRLRSFVVELFLSGNGALIFSNAFVQWAASEALRRARPRFLAARFGLRSKPKPFTSIAVFENQQKISALRDEDDPEGSALDALILARYIWLTGMRYPERERTSCICVAEATGSLQIIAAEDQRPAWPIEQPVSPEAVLAWMRSTLFGPDTG